MASPTRVTSRRRKAKQTASGQTRKRDNARAQRIQAEATLEAALGEKLALPTIR